MNDKMISAVYGALSVTVWGATIALLIFVIVLFCTGQRRAPVFALTSASVSAAAENDPALAGRTDGVSGWYRAEYRLNVTGAKLSPFTYTVHNLVFNPPADIANRMEYFAVCEDKIEYSAFRTSEFTVSLSLRCDTPEQAKDIASRAAFGFRGLQQHFSIFYRELVIDLPGFSIGNFDTEPILA